MIALRLAAGDPDRRSPISELLALPVAIRSLGVPLGVLAHKLWARPPASSERKKLHQIPIEEKESYRWIEVARDSAAGIDRPTVTIADREGDVFELFASPRQAGADLLVRSNLKRAVVGRQKYTKPTVEAARVLGYLNVDVPRAPHRLPRRAHLALRACRVALKRPVDGLRSKLRRHPVEVGVVLAREESPPQGEKAIEWGLLTTLPVETFDEAVNCVRFYTFRWLIERYHFVLKSGCHIEELQLESVDRLARALATYVIVAWRLLWLTYENRIDPTLPASVALSKDEWQSLACYMTKRRTPPKTPPTLHEAIVWIARLGGFLARKHDGEPGAKTIWRGFMRLTTIVEVWTTAREVYA